MTRAEAKIVSSATLSAAALAVALLSASRLHVARTFPPSGTGTLVLLCLMVVALVLAMRALTITVKNHSRIGTNIKIIGAAPCLLLVVAALVLLVRP
jgi:hypothetical protein